MGGYKELLVVLLNEDLYTFIDECGGLKGLIQDVKVKEGMNAE